MYDKQLYMMKDASCQHVKDVINNKSKLEFGVLFK